jgi:hypothetical protein
VNPGALNIFDKIDSGMYRNSRPYPPKGGGGSAKDLAAREKMRRRYREEEGRLAGLFHDDLLAELGLTDHPKADLLYSMAWERGHSSGYSEVANEAHSLG